MKYTACRQILTKFTFGQQIKIQINEQNCQNTVSKEHVTCVCSFESNVALKVKSDYQKCEYLTDAKQTDTYKLALLRAGNIIKLNPSMGL